MNTRYIALGALALIALIAVAKGGTRMNRAMWTDRSETNPPLTEQSSLDASIERFWNLPDPPQATAAPVQPAPPRFGHGRHGHRGRHHHHRPVHPPPDPKGTSVDQSRDTRERRGYWGINLFNLIPLIDVVHGSVVEDSSDRVRGRK